MDAELVITTVEQLKAAGPDLSKQVPALVKLGEWYLKKAKTTSNAADFTKANALYNAALVRTRKIHHEMNEDQILQRIVETYREFLHTFADGDEKFDADEIRDEIHSHKEFLVTERQTLKERVDEISSFLSKSNTTTKEHEIHSATIQEVFQDIQNMYIRLVSMLAKECESKLGKPPCNYAIIALGSVARMEATPFSDLEFAILHSNEATGDEINYFRVLTHFLHLKVINLGETILPALAIEELNDFQSSDPNGSWFYDSETPRGISFDGAMPWASKTPLGRIETKNKPPLELIRTPEQMAEFQDEETALKEGYHLADIMSRAALLYGDEALLNDYNERVDKKLNAKSSETEGKCSKTVGVNRAMQQMVLDIETYEPFDSYMGVHTAAGANFNAKNQLYRLISLLLSDLGMIFDIRCPSPWLIISELLARGIISESQSFDMRECLSFANEIRLRTYLANKGQRELISPVPHHANPKQQSAHAAVFQDVNQHILVRFLSTSNDIHKRCKEFCIKSISEDKIDSSIFRNTTAPIANALLLGLHYYRLQNFHEALEWMKTESEESPFYVDCLVAQGNIYLKSGEYDKSIKCFEEAMQLGYQKRSNADVAKLYNGLANALIKVGKYKMAVVRMEEGISKHTEIFGEKSQSNILLGLLASLGYSYHILGDFRLALKTLKEALEMQKELKNVPDVLVAFLNMIMAVTLSELGQYAESIEYIEKALQLSYQIFGKDNLSINLAETYNVAGKVYGRCNRKDEAVSFFRRSVELYERIVGDNPHPGKIEALINLGAFFFDRGQTREAIENFQNALKLAREINNKKPHDLLARSLSNTGAALVVARKLEESLLYLVEAKEVMDKLLGPNHSHPLTSSILYNLGTSYHMLGDLSNALSCLENALNINCELYGEMSSRGDMEGICSNIALILKKMKLYGRAKEYFTKTIEFAKKNPLTKDNCFVFIKYLYHLAMTCVKLNEGNETLKHLEEARMIAKVTSFRDWVVVHVLVLLIMKYAAMGLTSKSIICYIEAREIAKSLPTEHSLPHGVSEMLKLMNI